MFERLKKEEPNFIEKRRQWKGDLEKPVGRRTLMMILPAVVLSVFALLSAPYLKLIFETFVDDGDTLTPHSISLEEEKEVEEEAGPPPSPEEAMAMHYRAQFEREGFDWTKKPEVAAPDLGLAREQPIDIVAPEVELPATVLEMNEIRGVE